MAVNTDLVGAYAICVDISLNWWIGDKAPRADILSAMQQAHANIMENMAMLKPGVRICDPSLNAHKLEDQCKKGTYGCLMHGFGICA